MTNCYGTVSNPGGLILHTNAEAKNDGNAYVSYIQIYLGVY